MMTGNLSRSAFTEHILFLATQDPARFPALFRQYRSVYPDIVTRACLLYLAAQGWDETGKLITPWICRSADYVRLLADSKMFSLPTARRIAAILFQEDPQCLTRIMALSEEPGSLTQHRQINRALELADLFTNQDALIPWLRKLSSHPYSRLRSKAVKVLCELRPNRELLRRQLESPDERIRANALEALWHQKTPEVREAFRMALSDPHQRVVGNALVGLYLLGDETAFELITKYTKHPSPMFRRAMIQALGYIKDERGIALLEELKAHDGAPGVRSKAAQALLQLQAERTEAVSELAECPLPS